MKPEGFYRESSNERQKVKMLKLMDLKGTEYKKKNILLASLSLMLSGTHVK